MTELRRILLVIAALILCLMTGQGQSSDMAVTATVEGILRSDATLQLPNRYATTGIVALPQGDGYRVVLTNVPYPIWEFQVMASGGQGNACFNQQEWEFDSSSLIQTEAVDGVLTVVAAP